MNPENMHTLLFDIDGTLIKSGGAGFRAMRIAMSQLFGIDEIPSLEVHGRTDRGILRDLFEHANLDFDEHGEEFNRVYWQHLPSSLHQTEGWILPGVMELLTRLASTPGFALGILTGNARRAADIKLDHFELSPFFAFGGHGDRHACRNDVAAVARAAAAEHLGSQFDPEKIWVIGDTVNDIKCARAIESRVIAVETGGTAPADLRAAEPDAQLATLADCETFLNLFEAYESS